MIWCVCLILMENPVNQFGCPSSIVILRVVGISPTQRAAVLRAVGIIPRWTSELLRVFPSHDNAKRSRVLDGKCLNVPEISSCCLMEKTATGNSCRWPINKYKSLHKGFTWLSGSAVRSTHRNPSSLGVLWSVVVIHLLNEKWWHFGSDC